MSNGPVARGTPPPASLSKGGPADLTWLIGREREYPFEMPDFRELKGWYLFSVIAFAAAALTAAIVSVVARVCGRRPWTAAAGAVAFWGGLVVFGILMTPLANRSERSFVFTWPLTLIAVHQIAFWGVSCSREKAHGKGNRWGSIAGVGLLVLTCVLYFKLTRQLSLAPAWYFLLMLPAAWPIAIPAARRLCRRRRFAAWDVVWTFAIFTLFFWATGALMLLRTAAL
jgi:hypothetical protein